MGLFTPLTASVDAEHGEVEYLAERDEDGHNHQQGGQLVHLENAEGLVIQASGRPEMVDAIWSL